MLFTILSHRRDVASLGVKHVGVIGFVVMLFNFYPVDLHNETCVTIEHLGGSMSTNHDLP